MADHLPGIPHCNSTGAVLQVLLLNSNSNKQKLAEIANHVEIGGRAAGLTIEIQPLMDFSPKTLQASLTTTDGLFVSRRLIPDGKSAELFLEALSCPLWIVSKGSEIREMAVLVGNPMRNRHLITYTKMLSHRIQQPITGLIREEDLAITPQGESSVLAWKFIPSLASVDVSAALRQLNTGLLFISRLNAAMLRELAYNCVICPDTGNA